jgi:hypothetical protein
VILYSVYVNVLTSANNILNPSVRQGIQSPEYTDSIMDSGNASPVHLNTDFIMANPSIHLDVERR